MGAALTLAARGLGRVWPNPAVGCVIVKDGRVVGRGWTQPGGRPHAETEALARAGDTARNATAYVSLEPCSHHGETPPCADALVAAGVARVVIAVEDPHAKVSGKGLARLRDAGIETVVGVREAEAREINAGFLKRLAEGRPLVTWKTATTLDGKIAAASGESQWITGKPARDRGHLMRSRADAIMVGSTTVLRDDPMLTCRLAGLERHSPVRVIADGRLRTPLTSKLVSSAGAVPTWFLTREDADEVRVNALRDTGVEVHRLPPGRAGGIDPRAALAFLGEKGVTRVLVEGGATLAASLMAAKFIDRIAWFRAAAAIGDDGIGALGGLGLDGLAAMPRFVRLGSIPVGDDVLESYAVSA